MATTKKTTKRNTKPAPRTEREQLQALLERARLYKDEAAVAYFTARIQEVTNA